MAPDLNLLLAHVHGKVVMITGAGGSIGSELTRQLLSLGPKALVLFELSEVALYEIEMEIEEFQAAKAIEGRARRPGGATKVVPVLGSVLDRKLVARTIRDFEVEVIYHAAAYKHVPIVETEPVHRPAEQHLRNAGPGRSRAESWAWSASCSCRATKRCGRPT